MALLNFPEQQLPDLLGTCERFPPEYQTPSLPAGKMRDMASLFPLRASGAFPWAAFTGAANGKVNHHGD
jgi:hypothetical protein